ncbi:unnamed protein product [Rotaria sp. Silwood1]|nr:unnamed protein product [Rotaria sp. Silwood1]
MAQQPDWNHRRQGCIRLIECIPPTKEDRDDPLFVPQLKINPEAQQIIAEHFEEPISIIVYVGNMGVGKSKLATITVAALEKEPHASDLHWFQSGGDPNGVTHGIWMWCEPLRHPDQEKNGSILILDCEGMGDLDENTGANLYFFCMIISTTFAVILRPPRVDRFQCDRLYHALHRFEIMKSSYILPNLWLLPADLPQFVTTNAAGVEVEISKEEWLKKIFSVDEERNNLANLQNEKLNEQYQYITRMLPDIDVINIDFLPGSLTKSNPTLDVKGLLHSVESKEFLESINAVIGALLESGGKRLPGSKAATMFMHPIDLARFMGELIDVINHDKFPNPDRLIEQYLTDCFNTKVVEESLAKFKLDWEKYAKEVLIEELKQLGSPHDEEEISRMDEKMKQFHTELVRKYCDDMIRRARHEIIGVDISPLPEFDDEQQRRNYLNVLPTSIEDRLVSIEKEMQGYQKFMICIKKTRKLWNSLGCPTLETPMLADEANTSLPKTLSNAIQNTQQNESLISKQVLELEVASCSEPCSHSSESVINASFDQILDDVYKVNANNDDIPKLFVILPDHVWAWNDEDLWANKYLLHIICECSNEEIHFSAYPGYYVPNPRNFFGKYREYLNKFMISLAKYILERQNNENRDVTFWQNYKNGLEKVEKVLNNLREGSYCEANTAELLTYLALPNDRAITDLYRSIHGDSSIRWNLAISMAQPSTKRARDYGLRFGVLPTGPLNVITDVPGVQVGQVTLHEGDDIHTGVTAILPHGGNQFQEKSPVAIYVGNGFGKLTGYTQVEELGTLETPIILTNTLSVPTAADALIDYTLAQAGFNVKLMCGFVLTRDDQDHLKLKLQTSLVHSFGDQITIGFKVLR